MACDLPRVSATFDRCVMISLAARAHRLISHQFGRDLFSMPALDMLLDLYMRKDRQPRSLTSLCAASDASERNCQRIIHRMVERGLLLHSRDPFDGRRINVELAPEAIERLNGFFDRLVDLLSGTELHGRPPGHIC